MRAADGRPVWQPVGAALHARNAAFLLMPFRENELALPLQLSDELGGWKYWDARNEPLFAPPPAAA